MSARLDLHAEAPPQRAKSQWEEQKEQGQYTFNKTIDGHYRHGRTGYARVACLFLTWEDDDLQCKKTEVGQTPMQPISSSRHSHARPRIRWTC